MGFLNTIKRWFDMIFSSKAKEEFDVKNITLPKVERFVDMCSDIYEGKAPWVDEEEGIKTIGMAKSICEEVARLTTLAIGIKIDGSARATVLQQKIDLEYYNFRKWVEYACAYGTIILKPNGIDVDVMLPSDYMVTAEENGNITGVVFCKRTEADKRYYTRLEYHRFISNQYVITNKCFVGDTERDVHKPIDIKKTPWSLLDEEVVLAKADGSKLDGMLFAVLRMPSVNKLDKSSPLSLPVFAEAIEELKDLDISYSRNADEILDSRKVVLIDSDRLIPSRGGALNPRAWEQTKSDMHLPKYVKNVVGDGTNDFYQEINPSLNTEERIKGINNQLSLIGFKCGFSNGYFVLDEKTGMVTATQVESDDRRTIQLIKDIRDQFEKCFKELVYAMDIFLDLYTTSPRGIYEITFDFGDITYNREEDRIRWWGYVQAGKVPAWMYFVKFEGMSEEEAKAMTEEAQPKEQGLFDE